ncbi:MAG TPA: hypothetical protein VH436_22650 [Vicinamibacterales bacterium]|jgi:hypothetical protein
MQSKFLHRAFCVLSCAAIAGGCGKKHIQTVADGPALAMPAPPSRVFAPIEDEEPLAATTKTPDTPTAAPSAPQPASPTRRRPSPAESERTEQPPAPAPAPTPAIETRELRAASSPADNESERKITDLMTRARQTLNTVDYRVLSTGRRENYDQAKEMLTAAEKAMKERNFAYAETLADKAMKLATELLGR